jgi:4-aminobutyrate aminotransferase
MGTMNKQHAEAIFSRETSIIGETMKIRFYPLVIAHASGVRILDANGKEYLDFSASAGVQQTGYRHPHVRQAIIKELDTTWSGMPCIHPNPRTVELAERLCEIVPGSFPKKVWFGATGSDANDCLATLAPLARGRRRLVSYVGAYHGQTSGSLAISGHQASAKVIGTGNVTKVPYPYPYRCSWGPCDASECSLKCLDFLKDQVLLAASPAADTAAIMIEAIQSDGGDVVPPANYIPALRKLCDEAGIWLLFDEVKTGFGRTGKFFAFEHSAVEADGISLGKPMGGGLPLSAVVAREEILDQRNYTQYTLGGSPVACAGGLAVLDVLEQESLLRNAEVVGNRLLSGLEAMKPKHRLIGDARGKGLILGLELVNDRQSRVPAQRDTARVVYRCFELGLVLIYTGLLGNVIELTPPLIVRDREADEALEILDHALSDVEAGRFDDAKLADFSGW